MSETHLPPVQGQLQGTGPYHWPWRISVSWGTCGPLQVLVPVAAISGSLRPDSCVLPTGVGELWTDQDLEADEVVMRLSRY